MVYLCIRVEEITRTDAADSAKQNDKKMATLNYTTREINRNFKIKDSGIVEGRKVNTLVGVRGFLAYVGDIELANRLLNRAFESANDKEICKLRRGIRISFYYC